MGEEGQKGSYCRSSSDAWPGNPDGDKGEFGSQ